MENWPLYKQYIKNEPVDFVELGVDTGRSLELWETVLPKGSKLSGVDIDYSRLEIAKDKYQLFTFDVTNAREVKENLDGLFFDVILFDACPRRHFETFCNFAPLLRKGGVFYIETFKPNNRQPIEALKVFMKLTKVFSNEFEFEYPKQHTQVVIIGHRK